VSDGKRNNLEFDSQINTVAVQCQVIFCEDGKAWKNASKVEPAISMASLEEVLTLRESFPERWVSITP
jgi:hypothetical protein